MSDQFTTIELVQKSFINRDDRFAMVSFKAETAESDLKKLGLSRLPSKNEHHIERGSYWIKVGAINTNADQSGEYSGIRFADDAEFTDRFFLTLGGDLLWKIATDVVVIYAPRVHIVKETPRQNGSIFLYVPTNAIEQLPILSYCNNELIVGFNFTAEHLPGQPYTGLGGSKEEWGIRL